MDWTYLFASMNGRINRRPYWMGILVFIVLSIIAAILDGVLGTPRIGGMYGSGLISSILSLALIYPSIALSAKRWHDRNKSAWWVLIAVIPIIGWIWVLVENGFLAGTPGPNSYGPDPLQG